MKKLLLSVISIFAFNISQSQILIDTLAMQNFDTLSLYNPNWAFTGPVVYNTMGMSPTAASPSNSPTGIGGSNSWESTTQSSGIVLTFSTINIPAGYDSIRARFSLAAMNLASTGGGPDNLDYVLTEVSFNGGPYYNRLRIRGAVANNSWWPYAATGKAKVYYQPQSESTFAPTNSGLQTTEGYSYCEIVFPGSVTSVSIRMTGRSSSSTDSWLVYNVLLTGEKLATGINSITKNNSIRIYPNPANDVVHINRITNTNSTLFVYNTLGELVITKELSKENENVNISTLSNGVYFFKVDGSTKKIIKQ
jgi:hypothetical protein